MTEVATQPSKEGYLIEQSKLDTSSAPEWIKAIRAAGVERFASLEYPNRRQEEWRFTNVNPIVRTQFRSLVAPSRHGLTREQLAPFCCGNGQWTEVMFVDGFLARDLSTFAPLPQGVRAGSLAEYLATEEQLMKPHLGQYAAEANIFASLNAAFLQEGAYVCVPANQVVEAPIHLIYVTTANADQAAIHPRNLMVLGPNSAATIVETYVHLAGAGPYFVNAVTEVVLEQGARLSRCKLVAEAPQGYHLETALVRQSRDSNLECHTMTLSGQIVRNELQVQLAGEGAQCSLNGLYLNDGDRLIDNAVLVDHIAPQCISRMHYKGILDGTSKSAFTGRVQVQRYAQKTDSNQLNRTLLLSDTATIDTKPQLAIYADDVKCTHGAAIGPPPETMLFYFRSRGIARDKAKAMMTCGFAGEVVDTIPVEPVRERLTRIVYNKYSPNGHSKQ